MASATDTRRILDAISALERNQQLSLNALNVTVAALDVKVATMGAQVNSITGEMREKASRSELLATEVRLKEDMGRMEREVDKDVQGFQGMYESVIQEMKDLRDQVTHLTGTVQAVDSRIKTVDERLVKIEPLRDEWMKLLGARWFVATASAVLSSGATAAIIKVLSK